MRSASRPEPLGSMTRRWCATPTEMECPRRPAASCMARYMAAWARKSSAGAHRLDGRAPRRRPDAEQVGLQGEHVGLVDGDPELAQVAERLDGALGEAREERRQILREQAARCAPSAAG